jgi:hypothetical protein
MHVMDNYQPDNQQFPPEPPHGGPQHRPKPHSFSLRSVFGPPPSGQHETTAYTYRPVEVAPQPVVQVLSPRGVEYVFLTITLFTGAINLIVVLLILINGSPNYDVLAFPTAALLVTVPVFSWLFLRLKKAELRNPKLALDPSKRRSTQFTEIIAFATCFFTLITFIFYIFAKAGGNYKGSMFKMFLDVLVILVVAGGVLAYYWFNEHQV